MTERDHMRKLSKRFNASGKCVFTIMPDTGGMSHRKGYDAFIIYLGRHIAVEGKAGNGKLKAHQVEALAEAAEHGAPTLVIRFISAGASFIKFDLEDEEEEYKDLTWKALSDPRAVVNLLEWARGA